MPEECEICLYHLGFCFLTMVVIDSNGISVCLHTSSLVMCPKYEMFNSLSYLTSNLNKSILVPANVSKTCWMVTKSADPGQTPRSAVSHLGPHYLRRSVCLSVQMLRLNEITQQTHNIKMTSYQRRCDVITSHRR